VLLRGAVEIVNRFEGQVALITGGASGLGLAVARQLSAEGASILLVDWNRDALDAAVALLEKAGARTAAVGGDVSDSSTALAAVELAHTAFGRLDILVNNAGINPARAGSLNDTEEADWDQIFSVNLKSVYLFSRGSAPLMKATGGGAIVNTASVAGLRTTLVGVGSAYSISKAAMISLTGSLAMEFAVDRIRANCICPGFMETTMTDRRNSLKEEDLATRAADAMSRVPLGRMGTYDEVARVAVFLAGPDASYITGATLVVDGGFLLR
jgi:NAD(P)-dependent dehydrogenase (short-subunit alcohol dehydrogenase family)